MRRLPVKRFTYAFFAPPAGRPHGLPNLGLKFAGSPLQVAVEGAPWDNKPRVEAGWNTYPGPPGPGSCPCMSYMYGLDLGPKRGLELA